MRFLHIPILCSLIFLAWSGIPLSVQGQNLAQQAPLHSPMGVWFQDLDPEGGSIRGDVILTRALIEEGIQYYALYWGDETFEKVASLPAIHFFQPGGNLVFSFTDSTPIPNGAVYLIVRSGNQFGENTPGVHIQIDDLGVPRTLAQGLSFDDQNELPGKIQGLGQIQGDEEETDIEDYVLYWGHNDTEKMLGQTQPLQIIPRRIRFFGFAFQSAEYGFELDIDAPEDATHLLVFTRNDKGEMITGQSVPLADLGSATEPAQKMEFLDTDIDPGEISSNVDVDRAADEENLTHYSLYWSRGPSRRISRVMQVPKEDQYIFGPLLVPNTKYPRDATHLLVVTQNQPAGLTSSRLGEMREGISIPIPDRGAPVNQAGAIQFTDVDPDARKIAGEVLIQRADDESDLSHYGVYWAEDPETPLANVSPLAILPKRGISLSFTIPENTPVPARATHLLVLTQNALARGPLGPSVAIGDVDTIPVPVIEIPEEDNHIIGIGFAPDTLHGVLFYDYRASDEVAWHAQYTQFQNKVFFNDTLGKKNDAGGRIDIQRQLLSLTYRQFPLWQSNDIFQGFYWGGGGGLGLMDFSFEGNEVSVTSSVTDPFEFSDRPADHKFSTTAIVGLVEAGLQGEQGLIWQVGFQLGFSLFLQEDLDTGQIPSFAGQRGAASDEWEKGKNFSQFYISLGTYL